MPGDDIVRAIESIRPSTTATAARNLGDSAYSLVVDATAIHAQSGGAGTYLRALVSALGESGHPPLVVARKTDTHSWPGASAVHRVAPAPRPLRLVWEQLSLGRVVARLIPNGTIVLHSPHYTTPAWLPRRIRRAVTIHDLTFFSRPKDHSYSKRKVFRRAIKASARRADAIIAVSATTASQYAAVTGRTTRVFCAPHGVDHRRFRPTDALSTTEIRSDQAALESIGVSGRVIVCLGTIEPRKQIPELLRAYEHVRHQMPDVGLVLVGQQWPGMQLPMTQPGERRLGYVSDELATALLRAAAVVVYPSAEEGFGMPIVEAMACGAHVVAARSAVAMEVASDTGTLVDLAPGHSFSARLTVALLDVLNGRFDSETGSPAAMVRRSQQFTWEASARDHLAAYDCAADCPTGRLR